MNIQLLPSNQINAESWNSCIRKHANGLIYNQYQYLNILCNNWLGLVINDYEAVMALPYKTKYGIPYLYTPIAIQQLGLVGLHTLNQTMWNQVHRRFLYGSYQLNFQQQQHLIKGKFIYRKNYVLPLQQSYSQLQQSFSVHASRNLKIATQHNLTLEHAVVSTVFDAILNHQYTLSKLSIQQAASLKQAICFLAQQQQAFAVTACYQQQPVAQLIYYKDDKRIYYMFPYSTAQGKQTRAMHFIVNELIKQHANSALCFDFEGSNLPGVEQFITQFSPILQPYFIWQPTWQSVGQALLGNK